MKQNNPLKQNGSKGGGKALGQLKIGTKLILLLFFITFISTGIVGALSFRVGRNIIDDQINQLLSLQTDRSLEAINKMVFDRLNEMQLLIGDSTLVNQQVSLEEKTKALKNKLISLGWYNQLHLTNPSGQVIASTVKQAVDFDFSGETWYQATKKQFIHVSDVVVSPFSGKKVLMFTNTVQNENKDVIGVLVAEFSLNVLSDLLKNTPENLEAYLITGSGEIIAYHGPEASENPSITPEGYYQYNSDYLQQQIQSEGYFSFSGNGWNLVVQIPTQIAYQPIHEFTMALLIVFTVIALLVLIAGHFSSRKFIKPIISLTQGMIKMQKGDLKQDLEVDSQDEIGYLTKGFNAMTHDLDEKTQKLIEEKGKYKSILESTNEAIVLFDPENKLIAHNQEFENLFLKEAKKGSLKTAQMILNLLSKNNVDESSEKSIEKIQGVIQKNDLKKSLALQVTLKKPLYAILALYSKPVLGEDGRLLGRIWVFNNITEEIESERSKQEFIHVASHKLRTPITTVNWNSQMLLDGTVGKLQKDQKDMIQQIESASDQLTALSKILLNVAEIEKDKILIKKQVFDLNEWLKKSIEAAKKKSEEKKDLSFRVNLPKLAGVKVKADQAKVEQVLAMILDNAMRYAKEGEKNEVELKVELDKKAKKVRFTVSDQGIGIPQKEQGKIFTKFFRGEGVDLIYPDGTGLSLFLAKIIVDSSGQKMGFESEEGEGSRFWFTVGVG